MVESWGSVRHHSYHTFNLLTNLQICTSMECDAATYTGSYIIGKIPITMGAQNWLVWCPYGTNTSCITVLLVSVHITIPHKWVQTHMHIYSPRNEGYEAPPSPLLDTVVSRLLASFYIFMQLLPWASSMPRPQTGTQQPYTLTLRSSLNTNNMLPTVKGRGTLHIYIYASCGERVKDLAAHGNGNQWDKQSSCINA